MRIRFLNKNKNPATGASRWFECTEAPIFTEVKNETLDSVTIVLSNLTSPIDIEPYDIVELSDLSDRYMCVDTYTEQMICVNPKLYKYEISLFSETKQLENTVLPNLKITSLKTGEKRTVYDYIEQYMNEYCPKIRIKTQSEEEEVTTPVFSVADWEDDYYHNNLYLRVHIISDTNVFSIENNVRIAASGSVNVLVNGTTAEISFNSDRCEIVSNDLDNNKWDIVFAVNIGSYNGSVSSIESISFVIYGIHQGYEYQNKFTWIDTVSDSRSLRRFRYIDCPEMQWNTPTLREVLNDLMMTDDCIPVLRKGILTFIDLTEIKSDITDDEYINYISKSKSSEDYVSELQVKLENVTNNIDGVNNFVTVTEYVPYSIPDDNATMTTENVVLKTKCPIYNLKSVKIKFPAQARESVDSEDTVCKWFEADLMNLFGYNINLIYEYQEWITKSIAYNEEPPVSLNDWAKYQNWSLYYTRGTNEIKNFYNKTKFWFVTNYLIYKLMAAIIQIKMEWPSIYDPAGTSVTKFYDVLFKVEYETLDGCLFRASKNDYPEHERVVIDNQTNSMVDSYLQGFLEYQKANRLGNEQLQINARYPVEYTGHKISIGDFYEDSIVYQCQYQYFKDHTEVNAIATKNYVLRDYFTGVKSKIRSWKIASGSEALVRHDLEKYYCEFSWGRHVESDGLGVFGEDNDISGYFTTPITVFNTPSPVKHCYVRSKWTDSLETDHYYPDQSRHYAYAVDLMTRIVGNSLVFTFEMTDNYSAGLSVYTQEDYNGEDTKYVKISDFRPGNGIEINLSALLDGGVPMIQHKYTNENGEFDSMQVIYADNIKTVPIDNSQEPAEFDDYQVPYNGIYVLVQNSKEFFYYCLQRPAINEKSIRSDTDSEPYDYQQFNVISYHKKDSQEITNLSTQIEFCSDTTDICIGKEWLKRQKAVKLTKNNATFVFRGYKLFSNQRFNFRRPDEFPDPFDSTAGGNVTVTYDSDTHTNSNIILKITTSSNGSFESADAAKQFIKSRKDWSWYLVVKSDDGTSYNTGEEPILLACTNIPDENISAVASGAGYEAVVNISMNVLKSRNKNIYNSSNHYLIADKI